MGDLYLTLNELLKPNPSFKEPPDISQSQGKKYDDLSNEIDRYLKEFCSLVENYQERSKIDLLFSSLTIPILACNNISILLEVYKCLCEHSELFQDAINEKFYIESRCNLLINTKPENQNFEFYLTGSVDNIIEMRKNCFDTRGTEMMFANYCFQFMEENLNNATSHKLAEKIASIIDPMDFKRFRRLQKDIANSPIRKELNKLDFKINNEIYSNNQKGNFSITVHQGIWRNPKNQEVDVAIKKYKFNSKDEKNQRYTKMIDTEFDILQKINAYDNENYNEHFVKFYGYVKIDEEPNFEYWVVMELYEETLMDYVRKNVPSDQRVLEFAKQLLEGLEYLHKSNIAHLDIKPQNIFVKKIKINTDEEEEQKEEIILKIADFNISLDLDKMQGELFPVQGTPGFMAPELEDAYWKWKSTNEASRKTLRYDPKKADMYSLGLTLAQCLRGKGNENGFSWRASQNQRELLEFINRYKRNDLSFLLKETLKRDADQRRDASYLLRKLNGDEFEEEEKKEEEKKEE